jgi:membrane protease YdiL (CAAX protease family)
MPTATLGTTRLGSISPLLVAYAALFAISEIVMFARHNVLWGSVDLVLGIYLAIACALTRRFTLTAQQEAVTHRGRYIPLQLVLCGFVVVATGLNGAYFNRVIPGWARVPYWGSASDAIFHLAARIMPGPIGGSIANGVSNFAMYCIPIGVALIALGVPLSQQGCGRFKRGSLASAAAWLIVPVAAFAYALIAGKVTPMRLLLVWLSNLLQNGFSEEFLFRGAILGRLRAVMKTEYAIYVQAFAFGLWHLGTDLHQYHGDLANMLADMIGSQVTVGLAIGYLTLRTGNIAIGSAFHLSFDSLEIFQ